jgi:hypothetical protein
MNLPFHLEISHRGAAKSYRIVSDILYQQSLNVNFVAGVSSFSPRAVKMIKKTLLNRGGRKDAFVSVNNYYDFVSNKDIVSKFYFDEFENNNWLTPEIAEEVVKSGPCYFVSSPAKIRNVLNFSPKTDVLAKLITLNNGFLLNRIQFNDVTMSPEFLKQAKEATSEESFKAEILSQFLK